MDWDAYYAELYPTTPSTTPADDSGGLVDWEAVGATASQLLDAFGWGSAGDPQTTTTTTKSALEELVPYAVVGGFLLAVIVVLRGR